MAKDQTDVTAVEQPVVEQPVVEAPVAPQVAGEVPTNTARRQDLVDAYYNTDGGLSVGGVAEKHNVRVSDVYAALRDAATDSEAKEELTRTTEYFVSRGE